MKYLGKVKGIPGKIFSDAVENMNNMIAGDAWEKSIESNLQDFKKEDINSLKTLGKLLGKTDIEGQVNQIKLVCEFLDEQINDAIEEKNKNEKMYQKLGAIVGLIMVIFLI